MMRRFWAFFAACLWGRRHRVLSRDTVELTSVRLGLLGRPDRIEQQPDGMIIPIEKKSWAKELHRNIRLQVGAYLLLIEAHYGIRPTHGWAVLGEDTWFRVGHTEKLREDVLRTAELIRQHRTGLHEPAKVFASAAQCQGCGFRSQCPQSKAPL